MWLLICSRSASKMWWSPQYCAAHYIYLQSNQIQKSLKSHVLSWCAWSWRRCKKVLINNSAVNVNSASDEEKAAPPAVIAQQKLLDLIHEEGAMDENSDEDNEDNEPSKATNEEAVEASFEDVMDGLTDHESGEK